jgi:outer membrane lipoprotein carrier protein
LRADFSQSLENPLLGKVVQSHGTIAQRRPDRFLMRFADPAGDMIVSDGEFFWVYYPSVDQKQVFKSAAATAGGLDLQAQFIGDPTRRFNYAYQGRENVNGRPADVLTLVPKEAAGYKSLKVWLDREDGLARKFDLTDDNGVVRHIQLSNLEVNPSLSDALFRFTPPADARIIER